MMKSSKGIRGKGLINESMENSRDENQPSDYVSALIRYDTLRTSFGDSSSSNLGTFLSAEDFDVFNEVLDSLNTSCDCDKGIKLSSKLTDDGDYMKIDDLVIPLPENDVCDVCFGQLQSGKARCKSCDTCFHARCYGLRNPSKEVLQVVCDSCKLRLTPKCVLCNLTGGLMRFSGNESTWAHSSCIYFAPRESNIRFNDLYHLDCPMGLSNFKNSSNVTCDSCKSAEGLIAPCTFSKCYKYLHSRCAINRKSDYFGSCFSGVIFYKSHGRKYFVVRGVFCSSHNNSDSIKEVCKTIIRNRIIIKDRGRSSYAKYNDAISSIIRMCVTATNDIINTIDETNTLKYPPRFDIDLKLTVPSVLDHYNRTSRSKRKLSDLVEYYDKLDISDVILNSSADLHEDKGESIHSGETTPRSIVTSSSSDYSISDDIKEGFDIKLDMEPVVEEVSEKKPMIILDTLNTPKNDPDSNKYRTQRLVWQKYDFFRKIPYGPAAFDILSGQDVATRMRSIQEMVPLENYLLSYELSSAKELSECFIQQILTGCKGIISLLESIKANLDSELNNPLRHNSSAQESKPIRLHVLLDTGMSSGILVYKINKRLLDGMLKGAVVDGESVNPVLFMDHDVKRVISQVHNDLIRNSYVSGSHSSIAKLSSSLPTKDVDFLTGVIQFGLKDDLRFLNGVLSVTSKDNDALRSRKSMIKKNGNSKSSLKNLQLDKYIPLTMFECEVLKRCAFEMSITTDVELKVALMRDSVVANPEVSCLNYIDWSIIVNTIRDIISDIDSTATTPSERQPFKKPIPSEMVPSSVSEVRERLSGGAVPPNPTIQPYAYDSANVRIGKWLWPVVDDMSFLEKQREILESELQSVIDELSLVRQNLCLRILEENANDLKVSERYSFYNNMLAKYEAMDRWNDLVGYVCKGYSDDVDEIKNIKKSDNNEILYCNVCFRCISTNLNPLYTCSRCYMNCHRNCYGIGRGRREVDPNDYICRRCEYEKRVLGGQWHTAFKPCSIICSICGRGGGALKRCMGAEEWAHVFCLLSLMPETSCSDYISLEPWNTNNIKQWRREESCNVCDVSFGAVLKCDNCDVYAHPFCAWFHGFKFTVSSNYSHLLKGFSGDSLFQRLYFDITCNAHDPTRNWSLTIATRNKKFINKDSATSVFEGRDRKKKPSTYIPDNAEPPTTGDANRKCNVCFNTGALSQCSKCKLYLHLSCYHDDFSSNHPSFTCDACKLGKEVVCGICDCAGGLMKDISLKGSKPVYIHIVCGVCFPDGVVRLFYGAERVDEDGECDVCKRATGSKLRCFRKGCDIRFHPICGLENRFVVEPNPMDIESGEGHIAFCQEHSLISNSIGNNIKLLLRYRLNLLLLRNIINDLASKESVKRSILRKQQEILNNKYPLN